MALDSSLNYSHYPAAVVHTPFCSSVNHLVIFFLPFASFVLPVINLGSQHLCNYPKSLWVKLMMLISFGDFINNEAKYDSYVLQVQLHLKTTKITEADTPITGFCIKNQCGNTFFGSLIHSEMVNIQFYRYSNQNQIKSPLRHHWIKFGHDLYVF